MKKLIVEIDDGLKKELKIEALKRNITLRELVIEKISKDGVEG